VRYRGHQGAGRSLWGPVNPVALVGVVKDLEELHKKDINDPDNNDGVITHLELDNPEMQSEMGLQKHH